MAKIETKVIVFLSPEARQYLKGEPALDFAEHGHWFRCVSFEQNGYFLDMKVIYDQNGDSVIVELSLPLSYVSAAVSGEAAKRVGFAPPR